MTAIGWLCYTFLFLPAALAQDETVKDFSSYRPCECNETCFCVSYELCDHTNRIITTGAGLLTSRSLKTTVKNCDALEVCCQEPPLEEKQETATNTTVVIPSTTASFPPITTSTIQETTTIPPSHTSTMSTPETTSMTPGSETTPELPPENRKGGCGVRRSATKPHAFGTVSKASYGEFPWMVALLEKVYLDDGSIRSNLICGGSLISHQAVVTAAHCIHNSTAKDLVIRAGEWDLSQNNEPLPVQKRRVKSIIIHPDFNRKTFFNDVALLILERPLERSLQIDTVCLPEQDMDFSGKRCFVTGWRENRSKDFSPVLKLTALPVLEHENCQLKLRKTRVGLFFRLHHSLLCAGGEQNNKICLGDGGGPLICQSSEDDDRYYQAGVVAAGVACGRKGIPELFAKLSLFSDWINSQLIKEAVTNEAIHP